MSVELELELVYMYKPSYRLLRVRDLARGGKGANLISKQVRHIS